MSTKSAKAKSKSAVKNPITYYYNPYYNEESQLQFLEVWQVLEDDVLGSMYPWQYGPTAETSNRIVTLNFLALKNFEKDYRKYFDQIFIYKASAKLLAEGNVHRLGSILQPNLILCFDIYQLEKFGDKAALAGLKFLTSIGATIMIEGVDKAPVDVLTKYPASYFLLDYRYYNSSNKGLLSILSQLTKANNITMVVGNVKDKNNIDMFIDNNITIFSGSAFSRPKRKVDAFVTASKVEAVEDKKTYIVQAENAPAIEDKKTEKEENVVIEVTSQRDEIKARLAAAAAKKVAEREREKQLRLEQEALEKEKEAQRLEKERQQKIEEEKKKALKLKAGQVATSNEEFAGLKKSTDKDKEIVRGANVIKLNVSRPTKKKK